MKVLCPRHDDNTPSMEIYPDSGYCWVCGAIVPLEELDLDEIPIKQQPEDLSAMRRYIETLPTKTIRGLCLPEGPEGYYILWPGSDFYKLRTYRGGVRYKSPSGHRAPLFNLGPYSKTLVLCEGEFNALSLAEAMEKRTWTIASPGSCNELSKHLEEYLTYDLIHVIVDFDKPGIIAGLKLKEQLVSRRKKVRLHAVESDFNDVLQTKGKEEIRRWVRANLDLQ